MPDPCEIVLIGTDVYWGIAEGVNPVDVLPAEYRDCHYAALDKVAAAQEDEWANATPRKYIHWKEGPVWLGTSCSGGNTGHGTCYKAANLLRDDVTCDMDRYNAAANAEADKPYLWTMGGFGQTPYYRYCISEIPPVRPPPDPDPDPDPGPDPEPEPEPGPAPCVWELRWKPYGPIKFGETMVFEYEITGSFPPEVTASMVFNFYFDARVGVRGSTSTTGITLIDTTNRRVSVEFIDVLRHELVVEAMQEGCADPVKVAGLVVQANEDIPPIYQCAEILGRDSITVCTEGDYTVELTVCDVAITSPVLHVVPPPAKLRFPIITKHPESSTKVPGDFIQLYVVAKYATNYQWQKRISNVWTDISGETGTNYTVDNVTPDIRGDYRVRVWNSAGMVFSNIANISFDCEDWSPVLILTGTEWYRTQDGIGERIVVGPDTVIQGVTGIDTGSETVYWRVDEDIIPEGAGSGFGITYSRTGMDLTITITDANYHTVGLEVISAACEVTKRTEETYYGTRITDFGFTENPAYITIPKEVADYADPSVFITVTNRSTYEASALGFTSPFVGFVATGMILSVTPQFSTLGPGASGQIKITLSFAGQSAMKAGGLIPTENWWAHWQDVPGIGAFGDASGDFHILISFSPGPPVVVSNLRWGHSKSASLTEAAIEALPYSKTQATINADLPYAAQGDSGNYVFVAITSAQVPRTGNGIAIVDSDQSFIEAGSSEGFTELTGADGWNFMRVGNWMVFRSLYDLNNPGTIRITA